MRWQPFMNSVYFSQFPESVDYHSRNSPVVYEAIDNKFKIIVNCLSIQVSLLPMIYFQFYDDGKGIFRFFSELVKMITNQKRKKIVYFVSREHNQCH